MAFRYDNYGPPVPPAQRRGGPGRGPVLTVLVFLAVLVLALVVMRPWASRAASPQAAASPSAAAAPTLAAGQRAEGACLDATTSTTPSFAVDVRSDLARAVAGLAPPAQAPVTQAQPAVSLWIRQVDTASLSSKPTPFNISVTVPGAPGLALAQPSPGASGFPSAQASYTAAYEQVTQDRNAASTAAASAARTIASLPLDDSPQTLSAISACVSGLLTTVPTTGQRSFLIASDLEEDVAPQLEGSFNGAPLTIIQACDSGNASYCGGLLNHFVAEMHQLKVGPVTVVRPEDAAAAITAWVQGQPVPGTEVTS